jgi:hypothetical protein
MQFRTLFEFSHLAPEILFEIQQDDAVLFGMPLDGGRHEFEHTVSDQSLGQRSIDLVLSGKTDQHTVIDQQGNITFDCAVLIHAILFNEIDVTEIYCQGLACYQHDMNGHGDCVTDEFYGYMGQNGTAKIQFSLPIYRWFLQHCQ